MKKIAYAAFASVAALALAACGSSDKASEEATAENVEVPADEAVADATAMPSEDAGAMAVDATAAATADASGAAEAATADAEKKM
jgi:hypothetical protein